MNRPRIISTYSYGGAIKRASKCAIRTRIEHHLHQQLDGLRVGIDITEISDINILFIVSIVFIYPATEDKTFNYLIIVRDSSGYYF